MTGKIFELKKKHPIFRASQLLSDQRFLNNRIVGKSLYFLVHPDDAETLKRLHLEGILKSFDFVLAR